MSKKEIIVNGILLGLVIPVLIGLHFFLPETVRSLLVFDHSRFSVYTLWSSAWVHIDNDHLFNNILGYTLGMGLVWFIFERRNRQRPLQRIFIVILSVYPVLISLTSFAILQFVLQATDAITRGFSGINSAILGLLYVSILETTYDHRGWRGVYGLALGIILLTMVGMAQRASVLTWKIIGVSSIGVVLCLSYIFPLNLWKMDDIKERLRENGDDFAIISYGAIVLSLVLPRIFPLNWVRGDQIINIFGHFAGLIYGIIGGTLLIWYLRIKHESSDYLVD